MAQESGALAVVVNEKMQERTRAETATNAGIGIIAVGRDDLKWMKRSKHNSGVACGRK